MSVTTNNDSLTYQENDSRHTISNSCNNSPRRREPPPVLPKTFRSTNNMSTIMGEDDGNQSSSVYICVTQEKETELEARNRQMELELEATKLQRDQFYQEVLRIKSELQETQKEIKKAHNKIDRYNMVSKSKKVQDSLKCWTQSQPSIPDLRIPIPHDELADPQELIKQFIESERLYLNCLEAVDYHFLQPMKMFSIFKCDILSTQQFQALFLNSPQLLVIHRLFYQHLTHLHYLPKEARLEEFVIILERFTPSFSLYAGFQSEHFMVNLQRELSQCQSKPQFGLLLEELNQKCEGKTLVDLLRIIAGRLSEYQTLLTGFLNERLKGTRGMKEGIIKRLEVIKRFLVSIHYDLMQEKDWWNCIVEKMKILNRVSSTSPIPMDIFHPATRLIKQGSVNVVIKGKEFQKHLFLFTSHLAIADKLSDQRIQLPEDAMKTLAGAVVFSTIDTAGQVIEPDFHSGLKEDMLGFRINLSQDTVVLRVGKPNEKKLWIESIEKTIQMNQTMEEAEVCDVMIPDEAPKIAAASLEKLFQRLTNPQIACKEEFHEVFLNTYQCFTTPKDVLTALLNCIGCVDKEKMPQTSTNDVFTFNMEDGVDTESSISASNSIQNISDSDSDDSLSDSPILSRHNTSATSTPSRRLSKSTKKISIKDSIGGTNSINTDSDSSPYTSGVPISDNINRLVATGWDEAEISLVINQNGRTTDSMIGRNGRRNDSILLENSVYPSGLYSRTSNHSPDSYSARDSDDEMDGCHIAAINRKSRSVDDLALDTDSLFESVHNSIRVTQQDLVQSQISQDFVMVNYPPSPMDISNNDKMLKQSKISEDIAEASRLCDEMLNGFQTTNSPTVKPLDDNEECFSPEMDEINFRKYTGRIRRNTESPSSQLMIKRMSMTSNNLSFSEPDLVVLSLKNDKSPTHSTFGKDDDENDELLSSLPATIVRKFVESSNTQVSKNEKQRGGKFRFKGRKSKQTDERERKSEPANLTDRRHTLIPSASLYFTASPEIDKPRQSPSRGISNIFKRKDKEGKKIKKTPSMHGDHVDGGIPENGRRSRTGRSSSLAPSLDRHVYINIDEFGDPKLFQNMRNRNDDGSPKLKRRTTQTIAYRNFTLASKVFLILGKWIETHFEDFQDNPDMMATLDDFLQSMMSCESNESKLAEHLYTTVNHIKQRRKLHSLSLSSSLTGIEDSLKSLKVLGVRSIDLGKSSNLSFIKAFAEQLTLIAYSCYSDITRGELLNCNWKKKEKEILSPNISILIKQTNEMTSWISTEVLLQDSPSSRAIVLEHFISMAMICYKHHDLHCALSIAVALSSAPIKRLTKTWDAVEKKTKHKFDKLKDVSDPQEKCKKLREKLERVTESEREKYNRIPSCLPYLGAYLDLIYTLDIGVKTYNADGLVNFIKMTKLSSLINKFLQYQRTPYPFETKQDIVDYITSAKRLSENELYDLSIMKEPSKG